MYVAALSFLVVAVDAWVTWHWWEVLSENDTPTNVMRNMALIGGGLVAWVFAFWRSSIAGEQADVARREHQHGRFQRATELLAQHGETNSLARLSGLHALRHLIRDAPELGSDVIQVVTTFMLQASEAAGHAERELTLARLTAQFVCETMDRERVLTAAAREELRVEVTHAVAVVADRLSETG